jgi:hypothetical protein
VNSATPVTFLSGVQKPTAAPGQGQAHGGGGEKVSEPDKYEGQATWFSASEFQMMLRDRCLLV